MYTYTQKSVYLLSLLYFISARRLLVSSPIHTIHQFCCILLSKDPITARVTRAALGNRDSYPDMPLEWRRSCVNETKREKRQCEIHSCSEKEREARMSERELRILLDSDRTWGAHRYGLHCISLRSNYSLFGLCMLHRAGSEKQNIRQQQVQTALASQKK